MDIFESKIGKEKKYLELVAPYVVEAGYEVYDLEYLPSSTTLRLYIMNSETNTADLNDCITVDKALSEPFETTEWIPDSIVLEVSSPGMYRNLATKAHFDLALNEYIQVVIRGTLPEVPEALTK